MPTVGVCGASWMAATQNLHRIDCSDSAGKHFTEILAKKLDHKYITLARGAVSNSAIRLQINEMIRRQVDFIIFGSETENRIEVPIKSGFNPELGIYNINYGRTPDQSALESGFAHDNMESDTLNNFFDRQGNKNKNYLENLTDDQFDAVKHYTAYLYDPKFRQLQDVWIIESTLLAIRQAKIPYLFLPHAAWVTAQSDYLSKSDPRIVSDGRLGPYRYNNQLLGKSSTRRWHTTDDDQIKIANNVYEYIQTHNLLAWQL